MTQTHHEKVIQNYQNFRKDFRRVNIPGILTGKITNAKT